MIAVLEQVFLSRVEAIEALGRPAGAFNSEAMENVVARLHASATAFGRAPAAKLWWAFAEAFECARLIEAWRAAVLAAEAESNRFLVAARVRLHELKSAVGSTVFERGLLEVLAPIEDELKFSSVLAIRQALARVPMPVFNLSDPKPVLPDWAYKAKSSNACPPDELAVAFIEFNIDGRPAERIQWLRPHEVHDLEIAIRVSRWPDDATSIRLSPITVEPARAYDFPVFEFERPKGLGAHLFKQRGRMVLHAAQSFAAHPFEFVYAAEFQPIKSEQPVIVAGHRTLRLEGFDIEANPISGYPAIDRKILALREQLRVEPLIAESDLVDVLTTLGPLANLMGQAVQNARYPEPLLEAAFQRDVCQWLRQSPSIGVHLEEQAEAGGGRTDLSFRGIRIELKSERVRNLGLEDCRLYAEQAAAYAVATNRRLAILVVLDGTPKTRPAFPAEDGLMVIPVQTETAVIYVVCCLVQGGAPKPSSFSR